MAISAGEIEATLRLRDEFTAIAQKVTAQMNEMGAKLKDVPGHAESAGSSMQGLADKITEAFEHPVDTIKNLSKEFGTTLMESVGGAGTALLGLGAIMSAVGVIAFELTEKAAQIGGELNDMGEKTGIAVPVLSHLSNAARVAGTDIGTLSNAVFMMQKNMAENPDRFEEGLRRLNIDFAEFRTLKPDEMLFAIANGLKATEDPVERNAAGFELMGRQFRDLSPALMKLNEAMEMTAGITPWTDAEAKQAEEFEMQVTALKVEFQALVVAVGRDLLPVMSALLGIVKPIASGAKEVAIEWTGVSDIFHMVAEAWRTAAAAKELLFGSTSDEHVKTAAERMKEYEDSVKDAAKSPDKLVDAWKKQAAMQAGVIDPGMARTTLNTFTLRGVYDDLGNTYDKVHKQNEESAKSTKKLGEELKTHEAAVRKVESAFFGLTESVGRADDRDIKFMETLPKMRAEVDKVEQAGRVANFGFKGMADELDKVGEKVNDVGPDIAHQFVGPLREGAQEANKFAESLKGLWQGISGGGGLGGVFTNLGMGIMNGLGSLVTGGLSSLMSKGVGLVVDGFKHLFGGVSEAEKQGRAAVQDFEKQLASLLTQTQKTEAGNEQWKMTTIAVRDAYLATGHTAAEAEAAVKKLWDSSKGGAAAAKAAIDEVNAVLDEQKQDQADLDEAVKRYGFSIEELGPAMRRQELTKQAAQIENDFRLLVASGIDVGTTIDHMSGAINDFIHLAQKTGSEVPSEMKPILEKMVEMGLLTDSNGDKITDLGASGITFSETMTQGFQKVVDKLTELINKIADTTGQLNAIPPRRDVDVVIHGKWDIPPMPDLGGGNAGVEQMASGGAGHATGPMWFYTAGNEDFAFSGEGRRFSGGGGDNTEILEELRLLRSVLPKAVRDAVARS